jgi:hypothetical protein
MKGSGRISLTVVVFLLVAVAAAFGQTAYRISAPYTYQNLTIFLIHGADMSSNKNLITLQEAMEMKVFKVYETEDVDQLIVENLSPKYDVFIQAGDIVKGGKQDRVLAISIIIPKRSGKVSIEAFCVEAERWDGRGNESEKEFSSSEERIVSRELKIATQGKQTGSGTGTGSGSGTGTGRGDGDGFGDPSANAIATLPGTTGSQMGRGTSEVMTVARRGSQTEVWNEVANAQKNLSANMSVDVTKNTSSSSLQLSLENKKLEKAREGLVKKLAEITKDKTDVIGYAFAINGEINSADIYVSNHLFAKLWPKMLKAAVTEAISLADKPKNETEPNPGDINTFIAEAEKGAKKERQTVAKSKVVTRSSKNEAVYEARDKADVVVHRNYVKLN